MTPSARVVIGLAAWLCTAGSASAQDTVADPVLAVEGCDGITELNSVFFAAGSASLDDAARRRLRQNVQILRACSRLAVSVYGWTDGCVPGQREVEREDETLSLRRAFAVARHYIGAEIGPGQVVGWRGVGEDACVGAKYSHTDPARGRRADSMPSPGRALSAARRTAVAAMSCDAPDLPTITLGYADGDGSQPELTTAGRARLVELTHLIYRCDALRISVCYPPDERRRFLGRSPAFVDPVDACKPFSSDDLFIRLIPLGADG